MTLEYATRLLRKETSAEEIDKLKYECGFNRQKVVDTLDEAINLVCDMAEKENKD